jgi:hypothetical protein
MEHRRGVDCASLKRMLRAIRAGVILVSAVSSFSAAKPAKYLAITGPAPLRLITPTEEGVKYRLLPLSMGAVTEPKLEDSSSTLSSTNSATAIAHEAPRPEPAPELTQGPVSDSVKAPPEPATEPAQVGGVVTPQMFLRFFNKEGSRETGVLVSTNLPAPKPPGSSSATYNLK